MGSNKNSSKVDPRDFFSEYGEARYGIKVIPAAVACASPSSIGRPTFGHLLRGGQRSISE